MTTEQIDQEFFKIVHEPGAWRRLGLSPGYFLNMRYQHRHGRKIHWDTKIRVLQKAGIPITNAEYSESDLVSAIKFTLKTSEAAREFGPGYVLEKWKNSRK